MKRFGRSCMLGGLLVFMTLPVWGSQVDIEFVQVTRLADGQHRFAVTLSHPDTGWDHYADSWRVVDGNDVVVGERILYHPHVTEQPFTRDQIIAIPAGTTQVFVEAHDSKHGWSPIPVSIDLTQSEGERYTVSEP